jgi:outer membrane protein/S-layer protein transport system outer membrane protein
MAGACLAALGARAEAETLADAIALAYQTNPQIQAQRAQLRALNETYVQARSQFGLRLSAEADLNYQELRAADGEHVEGRSASETVALSQPIFTGGRVGATVQAALGDVRAGRERLRQAEADLLLRVIAAYVAVRRDQQILSVAQGTVQVLQQQLEETQAKTEVRENTRTDLAQAQARLAAAQSQAANAEAALAASRANYLAQVGQNPGDLAPEPDLGLIPASIDEAFERAEGRNSTLLAAKFAEQASRARVSVARAQNMPSVAFRVQAGRSPNNLTTQSDKYLNAVTATAVVTQPLFTSGLNSSQIRRALELNNADRLLIDATRRNVVQTVSQQWSQLSAARRSLTADQTNVSASEMAFYGMRQEERQGLRSTIELLNAQQELTSAQIGLLRDRYTEYVARAGLLNVMGTLTVDVLAPGLTPYEAEDDFDRVKNKGALPTELVVKALDSAVTPGLGPPMPARETAVPDGQLALPPTPSPEATQAPITPVTTLMDETRREPDGEAPPPPPAAPAP